MFGWFSAKCPLDTYEKTWTEWRMRWLAERFGIERLLQADVVLPTEDFFPDQFDGKRENVQQLMEILCRHLSIDGQKVRLEICADRQMPGAAGHYVPGEQSVVRVAESQLAEPARLIATLAHELAHEMLLRDGLLSGNEADHEWVTDLLPVFFGLGVFAANSTLREAYQDTGTWSSWKIGRQGYLPARIFGYAFALFTFVRGEDYPPWANKFLRLDASAAFQAGLHYLQATGDSLFHPDTIHSQRLPPTTNQLVNRLRTGTPSLRLSTLWEIRVNPAAEPTVIKALRECLGDRDPAIASAAARALAASGPAAAAAGTDLIEALAARHVQVRIGAAYALGKLRLQPEWAIRDLAALLGDEDPAMVREAAWAICQYGPAAEAAAPQVMVALKGALIDCEYSLVELLADALIAICPKPIAFALDYFEDGDPELCDQVITAVKERQALATTPAVEAENPTSE